MKFKEGKLYRVKKVNGGGSIASSLDTQDHESFWSTAGPEVFPGAILVFLSDTPHEKTETKLRRLRFVYKDTAINVFVFQLLIPDYFEEITATELES